MSTTAPHSGAWHGYYQEGALWVPLDATLRFDGATAQGDGEEGESPYDRVRFVWQGTLSPDGTLTLAKNYAGKAPSRWTSDARLADGGFRGAWTLQRATGRFELHPGERPWLAAEVGTKLMKHLDGVVEVVDFGERGEHGYRGFGVRRRDEAPTATHYVIRNARTDGIYVARSTCKLRPLVGEDTARAMLDVLRSESTEASGGPWNVSLDAMENARTLRALWSLTKAPSRSENPTGALEAMVLGEVSAVLAIPLETLIAERAARFPQVAKWLAPPKARKVKPLPLP